MPASLALFFGLCGRSWKLVASRRMQIIALLVILALLVPQPANAQLGFLTGLIGIISSGLSAVSGILSTVNSTLQNVIGPLLRSISGAMAAIQSVTQGILDFQQNIVYPLSAINSARGLVGQVQGIYNAIRGIWSTVVRSATLANPQGLENVILSKDAGQIGTVAARFSAVYTPLPAATEVHPSTRDVIDSSDAASQAAMKRSMSIDDIADREVGRRRSDDDGARVHRARYGGNDRSPGWGCLVRSQAYPAAPRGMMRLRAIELAGQGAQLKDAARFAARQEQAHPDEPLGRSSDVLSRVMFNTDLTRLVSAGLNERLSNGGGRYLFASLLSARIEHGPGRRRSGPGVAGASIWPWALSS